MKADIRSFYLLVGMFLLLPLSVPITKCKNTDNYVVSATARSIRPQKTHCAHRSNLLTTAKKANPLQSVKICVCLRVHTASRTEEKTKQPKLGERESSGL